MADGSADLLHNLRRRRAREGANATRFSAMLEGFEDSTPLDDLEHHRGRLKETYDRHFTGRCYSRSFARQRV